MEPLGLLTAVCGAEPDAVNGPVYANLATGGDTNTLAAAGDAVA